MLDFIPSFQENVFKLRAENTPLNNKTPTVFKILWSKILKYKLEIKSFYELPNYCFSFYYNTVYTAA